MIVATITSVNTEMIVATILNITQQAATAPINPKTAIYSFETNTSLCCAPPRCVAVVHHKNNAPFWAYLKLRQPATYAVIYNYQSLSKLERILRSISGSHQLITSMGKEVWKI